MDLQSLIENLNSTNHSIILCLDANEAIYRKSGAFNPLSYNPANPTEGTHDGSLATLIRTCGLSDPLTIQHPGHPPPSTYSRGINRIDYRVISQSLLPAVLRSGIMPFDSIFISDH